MMDTAQKVPGVYWQDTRNAAAASLPTGVPAFVGLVTAVPDGGDGNLYGPVRLNRKEDFAGSAAAYLGHAITGFFDNGGTYCYVVGAKNDPAEGVAAAAGLKNGLGLLGALADVDVVVVPDAVALDETLAHDVQSAMLKHCNDEGNRIALLEPFFGKTAEDLLRDQINQLDVPMEWLCNAAIYYPWVRTVATGDEFVPPCGHVAGIIARTDNKDGVFKAPANTEIQGAVDLNSNLDASTVATLNGNGVNCLRAFPGRGIRIWGARTLSPDPQWRYVNVRRLVLTVLRWIDANMLWATFEPNVPALWARIRRELGGYLTQLWRSGALKGASAAEAFYVRCDAGLNPPEKREIGEVVTEIGLAPTLPAEFIVVSLQHRAGTTELI